MKSKLNNIFSKKRAPRPLVVSNEVQLHSCALLYINSIALCELYLNGNRIESATQGALFFIDRGTNLSIRIKKHTLQSSYHLYILGDDELQSSYEWLQSYLSSEYLKQKIPSLPSKTFMFVLNEWEKKLFLQFHNKNVTMQKKHAILNYFLSCMPDNDIIFSLISLSVKKSFSSMIRKIILENISNNWRVNDMCTIINMSESNIKKKLYCENYTFKSLLLETRMNYAAKMILTTDKHINVIASSVGYLSSSYFIKTFKLHFNITPKQLLIQFKKSYAAGNYNG